MIADRGHGTAPLTPTTKTTTTAGDQQDPIGFYGGDTNLYGYVLSDPVTLLDPWGTDWVQNAGEFTTGLGDAEVFNDHY